MFGEYTISITLNQTNNLKLVKTADLTTVLAPYDIDSDIINKNDSNTLAIYQLYNKLLFLCNDYNFAAYNQSVESNVFDDEIIIINSNNNNI